MTASLDLSWKLAVKGLKNKLMADRKVSIAAILKDVAGDAVSVRTARRFLLTLSTDALSGKPRLIDVHGEGEVLMLSLEDLLEILADPPPTLGEVMERARR
ncbi:hypothetical protein [Rhizobium sp. CNPSo 3490]|uniref:hypothetical protein n=1 Tax=Rhizobium sp. CNPSo 3490 TaxID=3021407 RepID=UPI00254E060A|nr:hypothetical protein [Rhizobium sp. CNPSo 3490]MDK4733952.1 hypothetical protein [Rhizobium sp. CNPSo 3490]